MSDTDNLNSMGGTSFSSDLTEPAPRIAPIDLLIKETPENTSAPIFDPISLPNTPISPPTNNPRPKLLSFLLFISFGGFIYQMAVAILLITIITESFNKTNSLISLFHYVPVFCLYPVVAALIATHILYLYLKTKNVSAESYKLLTKTYTLIPLFYSVLAYFMVFQTQTVQAAINGTSDIQNDQLRSIASALINDINLVSLVILLVTKKKKKIFNNLPSRLKLKQKIILTIIGTVIILLASNITFSTVYNSFHPDTKFKQTQTLVGHKLYVPKYLPQGIQLTSQYFITETSLKNLPNPVVKTSFSTPGLTSMTDLVSKIVIMNQTLVPEDFSLLDYLKNQNPNTIFEKINITSSIDQSGYLAKPAETADNKLKIKLIYFVTTDNILINFATPSEFSDQELIDMAQSIQ